MMILLALVMLPVLPGLARMPVAPFAPVSWIVPSFLTLWLLLIVTAAPPAGTTEPVLPMRMSSAVPLFALAVASGAVTLALTTVSAWADDRAATATGVRQVQASRRRIGSSSSSLEPPRR